MSTATTNTAQRDVVIAPSAELDLARRIRLWSGWSNASVTFDPAKVETAHVDHVARQFAFNLNRLVLNPNRVVAKVTDQSLRLEAVLTGAMLHEAGHARYTTWRPRTQESERVFLANEGGGRVYSKAALGLAQMAEEPRVELLIRTAPISTAASLTWTTRASALWAVHEVISNSGNGNTMPDATAALGLWLLTIGRWVKDTANLSIDTASLSAVYDTNLHSRSQLSRIDRYIREAIIDGLKDKASMSYYEHDETYNKIIYYAAKMVTWKWGVDPACTDPYENIDIAQDIIDLLDDAKQTGAAPQLMASCGDYQQGDDQQGGDQKDGDQKGDDQQDGDQQGDDQQGDDQQDGDQQGDDQQGDDQRAMKENIMAALANLTKQAVKEVNEKAAEEAHVDSTGGPRPTLIRGTMHTTRSPEQTATFGKASALLRNLIDPSEASTTRVEDTPSAIVDGAAMSAWKAGGSHRAPTFFNNTRRTVAPAPPVKVAVLVDVSLSMDALQEPASRLGWAIAAAAFDMRNFAGRGAQIEATLIHWGDTVSVTQPAGVLPKGMFEPWCDQRTTAMADAMRAAKEEIPALFEPSATPENKLIVHFTDWKLDRQSAYDSVIMTGEALAAGTKILSITPEALVLGSFYDSYGDVLNRYGATYGDGQLTTAVYDHKNPDMVWETAQRSLGR